MGLRPNCTTRDAVGFMPPSVGTRVRFYEPYRPSQVRWGTIGVVVNLELRLTTLGNEPWVRARFGDFITPWIE
jgi:hypothetical protein